jgi:hypothetical protein
MRKLVFEKHYPGETSSPAKSDDGLVSALGKVQEEISSLRKATDITEVKRKLEEIAKELDRSKKTAKEVAQAPPRGEVFIALPGGSGLGFSELNITWGTLIHAINKDVVAKWPDFSLETLGKKYVFVNESTKTQIDLPGEALQKLPVAATGVRLGDRLRLKEK